MQETRRRQQFHQQRAAELMGFHVIRVAPEPEELHAIAGGLPVGKIFATGRAFGNGVGCEHVGQRELKVGGSLCDVQQLAGRRSIEQTQAYIDASARAKRRLIELI